MEALRHFIRWGEKMNSNDLDEAIIDDLCAAGLAAFNYYGLPEPTEDLSVLSIELIFYPMRKNSLKPENTPEQCLERNELYLTIKDTVNALLRKKYKMSSSYRTSFSAGMRGLEPTYDGCIPYVSEECKNFILSLTVTAN